MTDVRPCANPSIRATTFVALHSPTVALAKVAWNLAGIPAPMLATQVIDLLPFVIRWSFTAKQIAASFPT